MTVHTTADCPDAAVLEAVLEERTVLAVMIQHSIFG